VTAPLPLPDDPAFALLIFAWPNYRMSFPFPRSVWLHDFEAMLRRHYPDASSKRLTLTARLAAPFPLAKPGVP
jgi:hypothetical protein